ncbi:MAG: FAD binding domain-containing protein [Chloroflexota bacterium]|nr:FAD binding domain-containing protein [Chloroflexota bacterium]
MAVHVARDLDDALRVIAADERAEIIAGGTDLMVEINFGRRRPESLVAIDRIHELREIERNGRIRVGAGVTYTRLLADDTGSAALREASRSVGSPQIRNAGTIGGNIATSSPAGDLLPVLAALGATIVVRSLRGERRVPFAEWMTGPKRNACARDELVIAAEWEGAGPAQTFMKAGSRNAMVISIAGLAVVADRARQRVGVALGSCGPTILRAHAAESFAQGVLGELGWERPGAPSEAACAEFGTLVASAARPIDDVRGTAQYRTHVLSVMGARALARVGVLA